MFNFFVIPQESGETSFVPFNPNAVLKMGKRVVRFVFIVKCLVK
jgi:hypothetical protein